MSKNHHKVIIFDTTMRDGELTPGVKMDLQQKITISQLYHVRIIAYDKSNEYKYDLCRNESI